MNTYKIKIPALLICEWESLTLLSIWSPFSAGPIRYRMNQKILIGFNSGDRYGWNYEVEYKL